MGDTEETNGWRGRISKAVETLEKQVEELFVRMRSEEQLDHCGGRWADVEKRLRSLEGFQWKLVGVLIALQSGGIVVILVALKAWLAK